VRGLGGAHGEILANEGLPSQRKYRNFEAIAYIIILSMKISAPSPLTRNRANSAMVRATIALDLETMMALRLKRPNQIICLPGPVTALP
jgi:hypothetical protein